MKYDVAIIGGGAAGIYCAINIACDKKVAIIERADRLGKKILATGNGRCNLTNMDIDPKYYNTKQVATYFKQYDNRKTMADFAAMGLCTYADDEGRVYPMSNSAVSVLDVLLEELSLHPNVDIITNYSIDNIDKSGDVFVVSGTKTIQADKLVVATGGNSSAILDMLGVKYNGYVPTLCGLNTTKNKGLAGVRIDNVRVRMDDFDEVGEVLFKDNGISGIVIFNLSAHLGRRNVTRGGISLDLLPDTSINWLTNHIAQMKTSHPKSKVLTIIEGLLHKAMARNIIEIAAVGANVMQDLTNAEITKIAKICKDYIVTVTGLADNNQVHSGGVDLHDLNEGLQYKALPNLYFAGEVVDVDGVCGGYNLQWAWTSGKIVGDNV